MIKISFINLELIEFEITIRCYFPTHCLLAVVADPNQLAVVPSCFRFRFLGPILAAAAAAVVDSNCFLGPNLLVVPAVDSKHFRSLDPIRLVAAAVVVVVVPSRLVAVGEYLTLQYFPSRHYYLPIHYRQNSIGQNSDLH